MMSNKNKRKSAIWKAPTEKLQDIVNKSNSMGEILKTFGLKNKGNNFKTLQARIDEDGIDLSLLHTNRTNFRKERISLLHKGTGVSLDLILIEKSNYSRSNLKRRLIEEKLLEKKCYGEGCIVTNEWNGKPISLQLDHKNGVSNDNRLENLRLLCPNCHSQTPTFAGKRFKKEKILKGRNGTRMGARKVERPSKDELLKMLWEKPTTHIAKEFSVSDVAVNKWAKLYGISKPPRGYWGHNKFVN